MFSFFAFGAVKKPSGYHDDVTRISTQTSTHKHSRQELHGHDADYQNVHHARENGGNVHHQMVKPAVQNAGKALIHKFDKQFAETRTLGTDSSIMMNNNRQSRGDAEIVLLYESVCHRPSE